MNQNLKILHVVPYYPPAYSFGGPVKGVSELAEEQVKAGHDVTVLTTDVLDRKNRSGLPFMSYENAVTVFRVKNLSNFLASRFNFYFSNELFKFTDLNLEFDIVHYHDFRALNNYFLTRYFKKRGIPQVMSPYGSMSKFNKTMLKNIYDLLFGSRVIKNMKYFFAVNEFEQSYIQLFTNKPCVQIPNAINLDNVIVRDFDVYREFGIDKNKKIILFLSRINILKNPDFAIKVFDSLSPEIKSKSVLLMVGPDDGASAELKEMIVERKLEKKVILIDRFIQDEKWEIMKAAHVFILPTTDQAFPLVMLEALSQNTPVVTSEFALMNKLTPELGQILKFDIDKYKEGIEFYLSRKKPTTGFNFIKENYSIQNISKNIEAIYREVI